MTRPINKAAALSLALALAAGGAHAPARAAGAQAERVVAAVQRYAHALDADALRRACGTDALCAAREIVAALGPPVRLERVRTPDTDTIRWAKTAAVVGDGGAAAHGARIVALTGFGRTAEGELRAALTRARSGPPVLDLRDNPGGDFGRMLRVAALLIGPTADALHLVGAGQRKTIDLPAISLRRRPDRLAVLIGPRTASSAEVLAALLRRHGGARLLGEPSAGKNHLTRIVPVDQDWRLLIPAERIMVPGETLAGGLIPDGPLSALPLP